MNKIPLTWGEGGPQIGTVEITQNGQDGIVAVGEVHSQFKHLLGTDGAVSLSIYIEEKTDDK